MKRIILLSLVFCFVMPLYGCGESGIDLVKKGNFPGYGTTTIGKMLDGTFDSGKWSSQENAKGETLVMFEGKIPSKMHETLKSQLLKYIAADSQTKDSFHIAMYTARHLPFVLGKENTGANFAQPLLGDCHQRFEASRSSFSDAAYVKSELDKARASLARGEASPDTDPNVLRWRREDVEKWEQEWNTIEQMQSPAWEAGKAACTEKLMEVSNMAIDDLYWATGDTVFFEWKIHSSAKSFELSRFGAKTMPSINLTQALKIIYEQ